MTIYKTYNPTMGSHETISLADIKPGQTVIRMFWSKKIQRYVTVPGASLVKMNDSGELVEVE
jgi:hypothetical protein